MLIMQVFISYSAADRVLAARLSRELNAVGISAWNAEDQIIPGDDLYKAMSEALESSEVMVVLYSQAAKESSNVQLEIQYALTSGSYRGRIVPVLIDFKTFEAGADLPWVLLKLSPVYLNSASPDLNGVVQRVSSLAKAGV
jgi:hypothetical protein